MFAFIQQAVILAGNVDPAQWWNTDIGLLARWLMAGLGLAFMLAAGVKAGGQVLGAKPGQAFRTILLAVVVCSFLFYPVLINKSVTFVSSGIEKVLGSTADSQVNDQVPATNLNNNTQTNGSL